MKRNFAIILLAGAVVLLPMSCSSSEEQPDYWEEQEKKKAEETQSEEEKEETAEAEEPAEKPAEEPPPPAEEEAAAMEEPPPPEPKAMAAQPEPEQQPPPAFGQAAAVSRAFGTAPGAASADPNRSVQVAIMASPRQPQAGDRVASIMGLYQREKLEKSLGRRVELAFISRSSRLHGPHTRIRYRRGFVKVAIRLAALLPHEQEVRQMNPEEQGKAVVDVMIYLGDAIK